MKISPRRPRHSGSPSLHQPGGGVPGKGAAGGAVRAPGEADPPDPGRTDLPGADLPHFVEAGGAGREMKKVQKGGDTIRLNAMSVVPLLSGIIKSSGRRSRMRPLW
mgnify:CR=1 FL=1